jgi:uncharacterized metal-binding protein YceD (DUF177 family)
MIIEFRKIPKEEFSVDIQQEGIAFHARVNKKSPTLLHCQGKITGELQHHCDRCGEDLVVSLDEAVEVWLSDKEVALSSEESLLNLVEFFDGCADFDAVLQSELEAIKSDYFYCQLCQH